MRFESRRIPVFTAFLLAGVTTAITIRYATFVPWGTDAAGYVGAARRWADGRVFNPAPLQLWAPWSFVGPLTMAAPLAFTLGPTRGTDVSVYPLGFPVFLAVADKVDRELGVYVVPPIFAGLLVWCTFLLGRRLAGAWAGVLAAFLIATSPILLGYALTPMSDVPAAAFILLAVDMSLRRSIMSAAGAGAAMAAAIMVRPILAPLAVIPGILAVTEGASRVSAWREWQWKRAVVFGAVAAIGLFIVGWSQHELYGGFFKPGYPGYEVFFRRDHILPNLTGYPRNLMTVHTPVIFLGLICAFVFVLRRSDHREPARVAGALCGIAFLNYALYLPYLPFYGDIAYLRFVLPALSALLLLLAGITAWLAEAAWRQWRLLTPLAIIPAAIVSAGGYSLYPLTFAQAAAQKHVLLMGRYLDEVLPPNAAVVTFLQSGAVAHYTGRQVVRFDLLETQQLEPVLETLVRRGYHPVFVVDEHSEGPLYKKRFANTRYERLDWRPRALFIGATTIWYLDYADRAGAGNRQRFPVDVLNQ